MRTALALALILPTAAAAAPADLCPTVIAAAQAQDVPPALFARLLWAVSGLDPAFVTPAAQGQRDPPPAAAGIAALPGPIARGLGLDDPGDTPEAIAAAARRLAMLTRAQGNLGLAVAGYDLPDAALRRFVAGGRLPPHAAVRVQAVTGLPAEHWRDTPTALPEPPDPLAACRALTEAPPPDAPQPWAAVLATQPGPEGAEARAATLSKRYAPALDGARIVAGPLTLTGRATPVTALHIPTPDRATATALCARLKPAAIPCMVRATTP